MVTLAQSNPYLRDSKMTHKRIIENVRQSSAFEGVVVHVRHAVLRPRASASEKKAVSGR
jgi:hypothetical protein